MMYKDELRKVMKDSPSAADWTRELLERMNEDGWGLDLPEGMIEGLEELEYILRKPDWSDMCKMEHVFAQVSANAIRLHVMTTYWNAFMDSMEEKSKQKAIYDAQVARLHEHFNQEISEIEQPRTSGDDIFEEE